MLDELCRELNNWFDENPKDGTKRHYFDEYTIENGELDLSDIGIKTGQYFRIIGSVFNDGIYQYPANGLQDEIFDGAVWVMAIPYPVIALANEIEAWKSKYSGANSIAMSPFQSESFGGYSYSKSNSNDSNGNGVGGSGTWQSAYANQLHKWRKIR